MNGRTPNWVKLLKVRLKPRAVTSDAGATVSMQERTRNDRTTPNSTTSSAIKEEPHHDILWNARGGSECARSETAKTESAQKEFPSSPSRLARTQGTTVRAGPWGISFLRKSGRNEMIRLPFDAEFHFQGD